MRAIKPFAEILDAETGIDVLQKIEFVGRTCYKSSENIKEGSAQKFVSNLIKHGHEAMLEHASFCFEISYGAYVYLNDMIQWLTERHGYISFMRFTGDHERFLISGNVRAWRDLFRHLERHCLELPECFKSFIKKNPILFPEFQDSEFNDLVDLGSIHPVYTGNLKTDNEILTHLNVTVRFIVDRGISHELVRHRPASFAQESTRYCNYTKDKFGGELTFIIPEAFRFGSPEWKLWQEQMMSAEKTYLAMIECGVTPEMARTVLPCSLKTEVIMTANCAEWKHFFALRACNCTGKAHPQMLEVAIPLLHEFKEMIDVVFDNLEERNDENDQNSDKA